MAYPFRLIISMTLLLMIASCTFNPFTTNNRLTGSALSTGAGAAAGVGAVAFIGQTTKPVPLIAGGVVGAAIGYYVSTLRFASGGVIQGGGQVFTLGDYVSIEIPTDNLFDTNTSELLEDSGPILDSVVAILKRNPDNNIMISGNTSGFSNSKWELKLSEARARQVAAYLWAHGIGEFKPLSLERRTLTYTGYGNYFPIANDIHNNSIRQNSRIQITSYPCNADLYLKSKKQRVFGNIGCTCPSGSEKKYKKEECKIDEPAEALNENEEQQSLQDAFKEDP